MLSQYIHIYTDTADLPSHTVVPVQKHTGIILSLATDDRSIPADGIYTKNPLVPIGIRTADCLPLFIRTDKDEYIGLHISRLTLIRGLLDQVPHYIDTSTITNVWMGPHICDKHFCFQWVGKDIQTFQQMFPEAVKAQGESVCLSIQKATEQYLHKWNVSSDVIEVDTRCTYEQSERMSYKQWYEQGKQGEVPYFFSVLEVLVRS